MKYIPEWFPGAEFKRKAKGWRAAGDMMVHVPYNKAKQLLVRAPLQVSQYARFSQLTGLDVYIADRRTTRRLCSEESADRYHSILG